MKGADGSGGDGPLPRTGVVEEGEKKRMGVDVDNAVRRKGKEEETPDGAGHPHAIGDGGDRMHHVPCSSSICPTCSQSPTACSIAGPPYGALECEGEMESRLWCSEPEGR